MIGLFRKSLRIILQLKRAVGDSPIILQLRLSVEKKMPDDWPVEKPSNYPLVKRPVGDSLVEKKLPIRKGFRI